MTVLLILCSLVFAGLSVFSFCKANYCACEHAGKCDNPINHYWLACVMFALISLAFSCFALHTENGTFLWIVLMTSCQSGAVMASKWQKAKTCSAKPKDELLTGEIN